MTRIRNNPILTICLHCLLILGLVLTLNYETNAAQPVQSSKKLKIEVTGVEGQIRENVLNRLEYEENKKWSQPEVNRWHARAEEEIRDALSPYGYFKTQITSKVITNGGYWLVKFKISPGRQVKFREVSIQLKGSGRKDDSLLLVIKKSKIQKNKAFSAEEYKSLKLALFEAALQHGYLQSKMSKHELRVNREDYYADVDIIFDTGSLFTVGEISFSDTRFSEKFLRRFLRFDTGDVYDESKLLELQNALVASNYFKSVSVIGNKEKVTALHAIPIEITTEPAKSQRYTLGAGYGTNTRFRASAGVDWRWLNPHGHYMTALITGSEIQDGVVARYIIPGKDPRLEQYHVTAGYHHIHIPKGNSQTEQITLGYNNNRGVWRRSLAVSFQEEQSKKSGESRKSSTYLIPNINLHKTKGNKTFLPTKGYSANLQFKTAHHYLLSETSFLQGKFEGKYITEIGNRHKVLFKSELGSTLGHDLKSLPLSLTFLTGGIKTVRGYRYNSLGPGSHLINFSAEYQFKVYGNWYIGTFYDTGNAFNDFPIKLRNAYGFGLIWQSPIGGVELSIAQAIDDINRPWRVQFSVGPDL